MAWSFRKRIKVIPGIYLNISKSGISTTIGPRGANINIGHRGTYLNAGLPGTGLSFRQKLGGERSQSSIPAPERHVNLPEPTNDSYLPEMISRVDSIFSLEPSELTSQNMQGIKDTIVSAHAQLKELQKDKQSVLAQWEKSKRRLNISYWLLYGFLFRSHTEALKKDIEMQKATVDAIDLQLQQGKVALDFEFDTEMQDEFGYFNKAFERLCCSECIWDITSSQANDQFATRSSAAFSVERRRVHFSIGELPDISSSTKAMIWHNANGADLYFYPNFVAVWDNKEHFAIIGYNELDLRYHSTRFVEEEGVPSDSEIVDQTWAKVNKNGQPDRRFRDNYRIPVALYGDIELKTSNGLHERYLFSSNGNAENFYKEFLEYQISLVRLDYYSGITENIK